MAVDRRLRYLVQFVDGLLKKLLGFGQLVKFEGVLLTTFLEGLRSAVDLQHASKLPWPQDKVSHEWLQCFSSNIRQGAVRSPSISFRACLWLSRCRGGDTTTDLLIVVRVVGLQVLTLRQTLS